MRIIPKFAAELAGLLGDEADAAAKAFGVIQRVRKFTGSSLFQTLVFGFLANPNASDEDLAEIAESLGIDVSPQAVAQRFDEKLPAFLLKRYFAKQSALRFVRRSLAPMLDRFTSVVLMDSTTISLPPSP